MFTFPIGLYTQTVTPGDGIDFSNVRLLLRGEGSNGGSTFTDSSSFNRSITSSGTPTTSTAQAKFGSSSIVFNGSSDYLILPGGTDIFSPGNGDFAYECWFYLTDTTFGSVLSLIGASSLQLYVHAGGVAYYDVSTGFVGDSATFAQNAWHYFGCTRSGTAMQIAVDGTTIYSATSTATFSTTFSTQNIGRDSVNNVFFKGYLDDARLTIGQSKDVNVVPTAAFLDS